MHLTQTVVAATGTELHGGSTTFAIMTVTHNKELITKTSQRNERDFTARMLYKKVTELMSDMYCILAMT